jgi:hypothetical protein
MAEFCDIASLSIVVLQGTRVWMILSYHNVRSQLIMK